MKRSSLIALIVCGILLVYLGTVYYSVSSQSKPDFTQQDAQAFLNRLAQAFDSGSTEGVLSFAAPDANVAGKTLDDTRQLLHRGMAAMKEPHVEFTNLTYQKRDDTTVNLRFDVQVTDKSPSGYAAGQVIHAERMGFVVKRILMPKLGGLMKVYEWKVTDVDAPNLPFDKALGF
jgi:hypothetical protein